MCAIEAAFHGGCPFQLNRREFLAGCAACATGASAVGALLGAAPGAAPRSSAQTPPATETKPKIRLVFAHIPPEHPTWPYQGYDYEGRKRELTEKLRQACPNIEFLPVTAHNADEARKVLEADSEVDGYLVYLVGIWTGVARTIAAARRPTIFVDDLYAGSGEFLIAYAGARREGLPVAGVSSSRFEDVAAAVRCFECLARLRSSLILDVIDHDPSAHALAFQQQFGTRVQQITGEQINQAYQQADAGEGRRWAQRWISEAEKMVEPTEAEIEKCGRMYVAMRNLMQQHGAQAITVDCLGLFYAGKLPAYPCLGFFQFNNDGLVGACEADLRSTITMLAMSYLTGRPGYISDPVIDTATNQIIYAHCVAPSKVFGPAGRSNPYHIRSHSEDRKGASVRSLLPLGETVTTLLFDPGKREVVIHQGKTVANIDEDKACRTKLACEVPDVDKLLSEWDRWGWHRVTVFGDHKRQVEQLAALLGFRVVQEG